MSFLADSQRFNLIKSEVSTHLYASCLLYTKMLIWQIYVVTLKTKFIFDTTKKDFFLEDLQPLRQVYLKRQNTSKTSFFFAFNWFRKEYNFYLEHLY